MRLFRLGVNKTAETTADRPDERKAATSEPLPLRSGFGAGFVPRLPAKTTRTEADRDLGEGRLTKSRLEARFGPEIGATHRRAALAAAGPTDRAKIVAGRVSLKKLLRLAARTYFGEAASEPIQYATFRRGLIDAGLESQLDRVLGDLPRTAMKRLLAGEISPLEIFGAHADRRGGWWMSNSAAPRDEIVRRLTKEGRKGDVALAELAMNTAEREAFAAGAISPARFSDFVDEGRAMDVDVVIIGAGAAGLKAANDLIDQGRSVVLLEAKDRPLGRTHTESSSVGVPIDHGAAFLHSSPINPFTGIAEQLGFEITPAYPEGRAIHAGDPEKGWVDLGEEIEELEEAWNEAGTDGTDEAAAGETPPVDSKWDRLAVMITAPLSMGVDAEHLSTTDFATTHPEHDDMRIADGFGTVVGAFAHGLPIHLSRKASRIEKRADQDWRVVAGDRTYRGKAVLCTASTGVLASGDMTFDPPLPSWKTEAIEKVPMGNFEKIFLKFDGNVFGDTADSTFVVKLNKAAEAFGWLLRPFGHDMAIAYVGGSFAKKLWAKGEDGVVDYAKGRLGKIFGPEIADRLEGAKITNWLNDPDTHGSFSAALPGFQHMRRALRAPVDGGLHFAGEACHEEWAQCVPGAWLTGQDAAADIDRQLKG